MKNTHYNRYYTNSSVIVDLAMGQNVFLVSQIICLKFEKLLKRRLCDSSAARIQTRDFRLAIPKAVLYHHATLLISPAVKSDGGCRR